MSCTPTPTATKFAAVTTLSLSTSQSQSPAAMAQLTTVVQQLCVASGTISGSSIGCVSSAPVTQVNTVGGGGQAAQVPIVVTVPITETQPIETLFAPCSGGGGSVSATQSSASSPNNSQLTTSVLVQSTPSPSTVVEASSTTLANGSVVQTVITVITTLPPTSIYVPTSVANPTLQSNSSHRSGTNVAPIVGGVLGGFLGLIVIVGSFWWLCRRRRVWDDIFEKEVLENDEAWAAPALTRRERDKHGLNTNAEPEPYQYGLVGHVVPPVAAGEPLRISQYGSVSEHSGTHSRLTSHSTTPLLPAPQTGSRPSTAGSTRTVQTQPGSRVLSPAPRSMSVVSRSSSTRPLLDSPSAWTPNMDELAVLEPLHRTGSPVPAAERRVLQIVNDGPPSPTDTVIPGEHRASAEP